MKPLFLSRRPESADDGIGALARVRSLLGLIVTASVMACSNPLVPAPSLSNVMDPDRAVPANRWRHWHPSVTQTAEVSDLRTVPRVPEGGAQVDPTRIYDLADLVDLALRANPATRSSWEHARAAAARLGIAQAAWLPALTANMHAGYWQYPFPEPGSAFSLRGTAVDPVIGLSWTLFDRARPAQIDQAMQQLFAANFFLNRTHQTVTYDVQRAFFGLLAARARVAAAEATVHQTTQNVASVQAQFERGLATTPERLLAIQDQAHAGYELQAARGAVMEKEAELAESLGITPDTRLRTVDLNALLLPEWVEISADEIIDQALTERPDLAAKLAELRAREAEIRKAEATYWPTLAFTGHGGWKQWDYTEARGRPALSTPNGSSPEVRIGSPLVDAFVTFDWNLFEGFAGQNAVGEARAKRNAAQAEFDALQLRIIREVWKAYAELKTAARKREFAVAMLQAADQSFDAARVSYDQGLATVIELLTAERSLAGARYIDIDSKADMLRSAAALVYAAGSPGTHPDGAAPDN